MINVVIVVDILISFLPGSGQPKPIQPEPNRENLRCIATKSIHASRVG
jgi:hypothetical protein